MSTTLYSSRVRVSTKAGMPGWRSRFSRSAARIDSTSAWASATLSVDDDVIVFRPVAHLVVGLGHAPRDHLVGILRARVQPRSSSATRRRQHEDADHVVAALLAQLLGALPVDVEQHVAAAPRAPPHRPARRAVAVAEHLRPFQQLAARHHVLELPWSMK